MTDGFVGSRGEKLIFMWMDESSFKFSFFMAKAIKVVILGEGNKGENIECFFLAQLLGKQSIQKRSSR